MIDIGLASEHLVCSDLILQGYPAHLTSQMSPYDIAVDVNGFLLRVQVKATAKKTSYTNPNKPDRYRWQIKRSRKDWKTGLKVNYKPGDFDILALVATDIKTIAYLPFKDHMQTTIEMYDTKDIRRSTSRNIYEFTFERAISELLESKAA